MTYTYQDALWDCLTVAGAADDGRRGPGSLPTAADKEQFARRVVTEVAMLRSRWAEAIECMDELEADIEALSADMAPETKSLRDMTRRQLRLYARRGRKKLRDSHMRTAEVAAQRDAAYSVIRRLLAGWEQDSHHETDDPLWLDRHRPAWFREPMPPAEHDVILRATDPTTEGAGT